MTTMSTGTDASRARTPPATDQLGKLFDKLPPNAIEAECALIGSMIQDEQVIVDVHPVLRGGANDFYVQKHGVIYEALVDLYNRTDAIDLVQFNQLLKDKGVLEQVGGLDYLIELAESVPSAVNAPHYAKVVRDKAILRGLIDAAGTIMYDAHHCTDPVANLLDQSEQAIFDLAETGSSDEAADLGTLLHEIYQRLENEEGRDVTGVESGFSDLDDMTTGFQRGDMVIVAARPSMGKTAFAINIAEHIAVNLKQPTAVFSLEMSKQALAQRILCARSGVDSQRVRRNMLSEDDFSRLFQASGELSEGPLFIDDTPGLTLLGLRARARRLARKHSIKCIVVDYLQLMSSPGSDSRQEEVSKISRGIKALARELEVPVLCLSQLNRGPEAREGHRPRMSDLRESGSIEQDADLVLMLHREEYYHTDPEWVQNNPDKVGIAEVIIAKQRNGPTGTVRLQFNHQTTRFGNLARGGNY